VTAIEFTLSEFQLTPQLVLCFIAEKILGLLKLY